MPKPISHKQSLANRRNAQKSTGPTTPEGKARSARNALEHGLLSAEVVVTTGDGAERPEELHALLDRRRRWPTRPNQTSPEPPEGKKRYRTDPIPRPRTIGNAVYLKQTTQTNPRRRTLNTLYGTMFREMRGRDGSQPIEV